MFAKLLDRFCSKKTRDPILEHVEFEGTKAHLLTATLEAFDDVVSGKIKKRFEGMPQRPENIQNGIKN